MLEKVLLRRISLQEGEQAEILIRQSLWAWSGFIFLAIFLIIAPFFFIYPLFHYGWLGVLIFFILLFLGIIIALNMYVSYFFTVFVMTNMRIIDFDQRGFTQNIATQVLYNKIEDITFESKGLANFLLGTGKVDISFWGNKKMKLRLFFVKNPQSIAGELVERQKRLGVTKTTAQPADLLEKIKSKIGEESFNNLVAE
ncbi:MAG: PH domain-containing protein [bacterium]